MHAPLIPFRVLYATVLALAVAGELLAVGFASAAPSHTRPGWHPGGVARHGALKSPIQHVVVIVQENRTVDNLFNGFAGADTVTTDPVTGSMLQPCPLYEQEAGVQRAAGRTPRATPATCTSRARHLQRNRDSVSSTTVGPWMDFKTNMAPAVPRSTVKTSLTATCRKTRSHNIGALPPRTRSSIMRCRRTTVPSFPAHQYLIAGQAGGLTSTGTINASFPWSIDENATNPKHTKTQSYNSCLTPMAFATAVDLTSPYPGKESNMEVHPCGSYPTIFDEAQAAGYTWKYYTSNESGLWGGPSAVAQDCGGINLTGQCANTKIDPCSPQALSDFLNVGTKGLADVTYVIPQSSWSDHARSVGPNSMAGPELGYVAHQCDRHIEPIGRRPPLS